jgi:hypothetical protein
VRLKLELRPEWPRRAHEGGGEVVAVRADAVVIEVEPLIPIPEEARPWIEAGMARDLPAGGALGEIAAVSSTNDLGWPMEIVGAAVLDGSGRVLEQRIGAFYKFSEWGGHALVRARDAAALAETRAAILAALRSGKPEWKGPYVIACIADLWS